jgi:hypothetical protein
MANRELLTHSSLNREFNSFLVLLVPLLRSSLLRSSLPPALCPNSPRFGNLKSKYLSGILESFYSTDYRTRSWEDEI